MVQGRLREVPLADLFQLIAGGRKSGVLTVTLDEREARIHFESGRVLYARVEDGATLGEYLVRLEVMSPEDVQNLISRQGKENPHAPLGALAVRGGIISDEELLEALRLQIMDAFTELIAWSDNVRSRFAFEERGLDASLVASEHHFDTLSMLMEATRRRDEWRRGQVKPHAVLELTLDPGNDAQSRLSVGQWELIHLIDGQRTAASVAAEIALPEGETYHQLHVLLEAGLLRESQEQIELPSVLVVSESDTTRRLMTLMLSRERYRVLVAPDVEKALDVLAHHRPNSLVLDENEPSGSVKRIREVRNGKFVPIVATTAVQQRRIFPWGGQKIVGVRFLEKPFTEAQLATVVGSVMSRAIN